jgi:hypothetical protein
LQDLKFVIAYSPPLGDFQLVLELNRLERRCRRLGMKVKSHNNDSMKMAIQLSVKKAPSREPPSHQPWRIS